MKKGVLLINLGTPDNCDSASVRRYLKQFLNDPYVIDLPGIIRWFLVNFLVIPQRYQQSAKAYQKIWLTEGSPLLVNSQAMKTTLQTELGPEYEVALGMRYGNPTIESALEKLNDCESLLILPLFPQYAKATSGSAIDYSKEVIAHYYINAASKHKTTSSIKWDIDNIYIQEDFYQHPAFITAYTNIIKKHIQTDLINKKLDMILFSYHGLPERQLDKMRCYKTQCYVTSELIAQALDLEPTQYRVSFQSRLGRTPWIKPYTDLILAELIEYGIQNIAVVCPSFVADCLETLEEINMRAREQWKTLGGGEFKFIPCLNAEPIWIQGLAKMIIGE